ncbi:hypothetical protein GO988_23360 [Hymenobacter sp. HMF4947]|uniref:Uncharacterized protein n=1 Tax=Hymenobacter ginkgonis TaxID=2682976 RepID=A0A7K1TLP8_9BACT|nr:hypothetical protein [Hymenobacter ginkgonis]MVN79282.1 hypothetical protein [Hymenobacter ginkgonis]
MSKQKISLAHLAKPTESVDELLLGPMRPTPASVSIPEAPKDEEDTQKSFTLRLYASMLHELQAIKEAQPRRKPKSIHSFIIEAIEEKIKKERRKSSAK